MKFYQTRKKSLLQAFYAPFLKNKKVFEHTRTVYFPLKRLTKPVKKALTRPTNYGYFFIYFSVISYISFQGLSQSTGLIPFLNNPSLTYQLKSLRKLRKQKRIFHKKKWIYGTAFTDKEILIESQENSNWGSPKNYRKNLAFLKNKYVLIPTQKSTLENFLRYSLNSPQRHLSTELVTIHGQERLFGDEVISVVYPPLHPRILRLYLKDKAIALQKDKKILMDLTQPWYNKLFDVVFFQNSTNRLSFLTLLNIWTLLCFCIFIQQVIEGFCFTLLNDGEQKPLLDDDPFGEYLLPSNLIFPENNTKNFLYGVQAGVATHELKPLIKNLQAQPKNPIKRFFSSSAKNLSITKGIIFVGGFDAGGVHFAQALAGEAKIPFIRVPATQFLLANIHEGLLAMRIVFYYTKSLAPAILHIDDIDIFCGLRSSLDLASKTKKSSMFSVEYKASKIISRHKVQKQTFNQAFQNFQKQKTKPYNAFISSSLEQVFPNIGRKKSEDSQKISELQKSSPSLNKQNVSEDDLTSLLNQLLIELDGVVSNQASLLTTATAKNIQDLEPALTRPGRLSTHIEFDYLYILDREKIIKSLLFKHNCKTTIPWYLFANQVKDFQYIPIKQIIENAIYYSQVFTKNPDLLELKSILFAKNRYFLSQDVLLGELEQKKIDATKAQFSEHLIKKLLFKNPEIDFATTAALNTSDFRILPYLYQNLEHTSLNIPQTVTQLLNKPNGLFLIHILENLWNQQQKIECPSQYHSLLYLFSSEILKQNLSSVQNKDMAYISAFMHFKQQNLKYLTATFTETKTLNLIDVFGNMQFISQWKQNSELSSSELEDFMKSIQMLRNLIIEYHAYLSYTIYKTIKKHH